MVNHQPQYIPSVQYFSRIARSDFFVFADDVQYEKGDWQNRNRICTANGVKMLTIPVFKGMKPINETKVADRDWIRRHGKLIWQSYGKCPGKLAIKEYLYFANSVYPTATSLAQITINCTMFFCKLLGVGKHACLNSTLPPHLPKSPPSKRLAAQCRHFKCEKYLCGESGWDYLDREEFEGIEIVKDEWEAKPYKQKWSDTFEANLSILDLIANVDNIFEIRNLL